MAKRPKQLEFDSKALKKPSKRFGGSLLKGNPKTKRTLDSKNPIHLVLKANRGGMRLPKLYGRIEQTIYDTAKRYGVQVYSYANVGNHLHLVIRVKRLRFWPQFIRALTGTIALMVKMANPESAGRYWKYRPFTEIVGGWRRAYRNLFEYVRLNQLEGEGRIHRRETKTLKDLRLVFQDI